MPIAMRDITEAKKEFGKAADKSAALLAIATDLRPKIVVARPSKAEIRQGVAKGERSAGALQGRETRIMSQRSSAALIEVLTEICGDREMAETAERRAVMQSIYGILNGKATPPPISGLS